MQASPHAGDNLPIISLRALRDIASYIGVLNSEEAIEFLEECGIATYQLDEKQSTSKIIYHTLKKLAFSKDLHDHKLLFKIICDSITTSLYQGTQLTEKDILYTYKYYLRRDGAIFEDNSKNGYKFFRRRTLISSPNQNPTNTELKQLDAILYSEVENQFSYISEIRQAYKLLVRIIETFSQKNIPIDHQLNEYYIQLFILIKQNIEQIHTAMEEKYKKCETKLDPILSDFSHPYIFKDIDEKDILYKPFNNLYSAESGMQEADITWLTILKLMYKCLGEIEYLYYKFKTDSKISFPQKQLLDEVSYYLSSTLKIDLKDFFGFEDSIFWLKRIGIDPLTLTFNPKSGNKTDTYCLMKAYIHYLLQGLGKLEGGWLKGVVSKEYMTQYIIEKYPELQPLGGNWNDWIKDTKGALLQKMTALHKKFIYIGSYSDQEKGYPIELKLPLK